MFEDLREIRRILEQYKQSQTLISAIDSGVSKQLQEISRFHQIFDISLSRQLQEISALHQAFDLSLSRQLQEITTLIRQSTLAWDTGISTTINNCFTIDLFSSHPLLTEQLIEPYLYFGKFLETTIERLDQTEDKQTSNALKGSLIIAQKQIASSTSQLEAIIEEPEDGDEAFSEISLNVLDLQQDELLASNAVPINANYRTVVALSPTARFAKQARGILALVVKCNNQAKLRGKEEIFKPTTRLLESYNNLPWIGVRDEESFGNFVDCLYFMLYEAAGKDHLRFLTDGYLGDGDCRIIWAIKHLRNKYLRHDPDHGKLSDIRKSWQDLSAQLALLGLSHLPASINDYQYLQQRLLQEVEQFLKRLLSNMIE